MSPTTNPAGPRTISQKVWDNHVVHSAPGEPDVLYIDLHLVHEVTSPQAFEGLRMAGRTMRRPELTLATEDHNVPTADIGAPIVDPVSRKQIDTLRSNAKDYGVTAYPMGNKLQGIVHIIGPEQGLTLPGMTIVCGDSHTATHGAFGSLAFGIGTSEVEHVMATQCRGSAIRALSMEGRMTVCNMSIEAGAKAGLIAPDQTTYDYVEGRPHAPTGEAWEQALADWAQLVTDDDAVFDKEIFLDAAEIRPHISWGTNPGQVVPLDGAVPDPASFDDPTEAAAAARALEYMDLSAGQPMKEVGVDVIFIGSCTNARIEDLRAAAAVVRGRTIASNLRTYVVPGSHAVKAQAEAEGLDAVFSDAGFDWREPGCSMCLGMNPDTLAPGERSASTSNRNFEGRQGRGGRTHLVSPEVAAATAIAGHFAEPADL